MLVAEKQKKSASRKASPDARPEISGAEPRVIKRYANRKLYDTHDSRYVTLQQVAELVREGEEVRIVDNRDQSDLTDVTLAQILYEEQKRGGEGRSVRALRGLIQRGGERLITTLRPVGRFVRAEGHEAESEEAPSLRFPFSEVHRFADERVRQVLAAAMAHVGELQGEVARLQARIEDLEDKLRRLSGRSQRAVREEPEKTGAGEAEAPPEAPSPRDT